MEEHEANVAGLGGGGKCLVRDDAAVFLDVSIAFASLHYCIPFVHLSLFTLCYIIVMVKLS